MNPSTHWIGDLCATGAACLWSVTVIFLRKASQHDDVIALKVFQNTLTALLFAISLFVFRQPLWVELTGSDWLRLGISAFLGITVGDTLHLASLARVGATSQAILDCLYLPFVILCAFIGYGEAISPLEGFGGALVLASIPLGTYYRTNHATVSRRDLTIGIAYAIVAQISMAICVLMIRDLVRTHAVMTLTFYRFVFGNLLLLAPMLIVKRQWSLLWRIPPRKALVPAIVSTTTGPFIATFLWLLGFKYTLAGRAAIYNQLSTVLVVILAAIFLKESLTRLKIVAITLAIIGALIVGGASS